MPWREILMKSAPGLLVVVTLMTASTDRAHATNAFSAYRCLIKVTHELVAGSFKVTANSSRYLNHEFIVDRRTGRIMGDVISSTGYQRIGIRAAVI
jgi:hypothetical protein